MKRFVEYQIQKWKESKTRKSLMLRGARQVGKTFLARQLGNTFPNFVEINFEYQPDAKTFFERDLNPERIIRDIGLWTGKRIIPGKTLLFLDEIQEAPNAIRSLRYFYEMMPSLHVIAAGSLLDFATEKIGIPVGRVSSLYVHPMSFLEFLYAIREHLIIEEILNHSFDTPMSEPIHEKILSLVGEYLAIGGMPEAVKCWRETKDPRECYVVHNTLIDTYRQDFQKYAKKFQIKYVELLFDQIPLQLGRKFKYSVVEGDFRKRELVPCLDLLTLAGVAHKVFHTAGRGIPIGAEVDPGNFKVIFIDVALSQAVLGLKLDDWFLHPKQGFVNKGELVEAFVGQELLAYSDPEKKSSLYCWHRTARGSQAEVDYLRQDGENIIPIEVKSGPGRTLKSLQMFLNSREKSPYGIRFSKHNYSIYDRIHSYPLYAIVPAVITNNKIALKKPLT